MHSDVVIVVPGDDPPQLQGSPHLERLKSHGEVIIHGERPSTVEDKVRRAGNAVCLINSRGAVKWPGEALRRLPRLKMISVCGIGTDAIDLETANHPLLACQQVVLTPHNADQTPEGMELLNAGVVDNVIAFLQGHSRNRVV